MSAAHLFKIDPRTIDLSGRLRDLDKERLAVIQSSMGEQRQLTPVEVRNEPGSDRVKLVFGLHRVQAAINLGWDEIDAVMFDGTVEQARIREIDENRSRIELSAYDQSNFLAERREIWERTHGPICRGKGKRKKVQVGPLTEAVENSSYIRDLAGHFGMSPTAVKRALSRKAGVPVYPLASSPGQTWDLQDVNGVLTWVQFTAPPGQTAFGLEDAGGVLLLEDGAGVLLMEQ